LSPINIILGVVVIVIASRLVKEYLDERKKQEDNKIQRDENTENTEENKEKIDENKSKIEDNKDKTQENKKEIDEIKKKMETNKKNNHTGLIVGFSIMGILLLVLAIMIIRDTFELKTKLKRQFPFFMTPAEWQKKYKTETGRYTEKSTSKKSDPTLKIGPSDIKRIDNMYTENKENKRKAIDEMYTEYKQRNR